MFLRVLRVCTLFSAFLSLLAWILREKMCGFFHKRYFRRHVTLCQCVKKKAGKITQKKTAADGG